MKKILSILILLAGLNATAQKPCEIDADVNDSIGTFKSTKQYMVFERSFAGTSNNISFSLTNTNGVLGLDAQQIKISSEFIKADCLDKSSRIYLQLNNGKIVTLIYVGNDTCGTLIINDKNQNVRVVGGSFVFSKENFEELKKSPVTFMRIRFSTETLDYPFKTGFVSELDKRMYEPENYFINTIKCIEN
ncbi:MAG: hypothetical protein QM710_03790 [Flavobacterium sp.]